MRTTLTPSHWASCILQPLASAVSTACTASTARLPASLTLCENSSSNLFSQPQQHRTDNQFLDSANGISVFLEEKAMDAHNQLTKPKALAVNKIGHAMHDLDPVFRGFSR